MKNLIIILSIASLTTSVQAEKNLDIFELNQEINSLAAQYELSTPWEIVLTGSGTNLWETLDTNKDGLISKVESSLSEEVFNSWARLDVNHDEKLNPEEFSRIFPLNN